MMYWNKIILAVILITLLGGFFRFFNNTKNPGSLNIDEVSYGYSAYSILKTAHDENGVFMPLSFKSTGDYKNPVLIYSLVPSIALFGLNEFSVRFTTVLFGTLTIPFFFLMLLSLVKNRKIALLGAAFLAISPWHIYYSRFASDHIMGLFFLVIGMYFFLEMLERGKAWTVMAAVTLILSIYSYHSQRYFIPLLVLAVLIINRKKIKLKVVNIKIFIFISLILILPLIFLSVFGGANSRAGMVFISQDIDYTRYVIMDHFKKSGEIFLLFFFWIKRYLNYFQPDFLFFKGLNMTIDGTLGAGVMYLYELPWLILGIVEVARNKIENKAIIVAWVLLSIIPASLTNNEQNSGRSLIILPMLMLITSFGALYFFRIINKVKSRILKIGLIASYILFSIIILTQTFLVFAVHFPLQRGEAFMEGTKETILYALKNQEKYSEIVYDPYRGIEAPYIVNIPHMYLLFYSKYNPTAYQNIVKKHQENEVFRVDKFTFRQIDWHSDKFKTGTLFIGSSWSLPQKDLKEGQVVERVYLSNGNLAFLIVASHK